MSQKRKLISLLSLTVLLFAGLAQATEITGVTWVPDQHIILIGLNSWPGVWPGWTMYVDGVEMSMQGAAGEPVVNPDAPVDQPPTGLIIATLPWVTGLDDVDFPCCGTIQFFIPGEGLTNTYEFNLGVFGCATASTKECTSDWTVHEGDLVIGGSDTYVLEDTKFFQRGNVYVNDNATLIIRNSEFMMARGDLPTIHVYFFVAPDASLIIENSWIYPPPEGGTEGGLVCVMNQGHVQMTDSETQIHYFDMSGTAQFEMTRSSMVNDIGGLLQVTGGTTTVTDSTIGALGLGVSAGAHLNVDGLESGGYFDSWDVHDMIPDADYDLTFTRTTVLADDFTGDLEHGPYERGWIFFLDRDAHVRMSNAHCRKIFLDVQGGDTVVFQDLKVGIPSSLSYRDIILTNVVVNGEWPVTIESGDVTISDSDYLFLQPSGWATVHLINSHLVEFIPRDFAGTVTFENSSWTCAGEFSYGHNTFTMNGSLSIGDELRENLQWGTGVVTRQFDVIATDVIGEPVEGLVIKTQGLWIDDNTGTYVTDEHGEATFNIKFCSLNYKQEVPGSVEDTDPSAETPLVWEVWQSGNLISRQPLEFFTETPLRVEGLSTSTPAVFRVTQGGTVLADSAFYGAAFNSGSADVAEWVSVSESVEPGDVLELDPNHPGQYRKSRGPCSDLVAGVVSTKPGFVLGTSPSTLDFGPRTDDSRSVTENSALLALIGIVPVKVNDEGGPIKAGDLLVTSSTLGCATRWNPVNNPTCTFVGKALEAMTKEKGVILVLLTTH